MSWLRPLRRSGGRPTFFRIYLLGGTVLLAVGLLFYFQSLTRRVEAQTEAMSSLVANVIALSTLAVETSPDSSAHTMLQEQLRSLNFPVILTDVAGLPLAWNARVGVPPLSISRLEQEDLETPGPELARVLEVLRDMDAQHTPVPMTRPGSDEALILLHYGSPGLLAELRWTPWITIAVGLLFGLTALLMLRGQKRAEEGFIWAGMAKETAHQMGTPLSSLVGWMELMREESQVGRTEAVVPRELFEEVLHEVGRDAERLNRVAARFSQIGSKPRLARASVLPVVQATVDYFRRRVPEGFRLELQGADDLPEVQLNAELMGWVLENLIKNAMNAADKEHGRVRVEVGARGDGIEIRVRDNGRGVQPGMEERIFRPGVSTRTRGWGLGLPLSRRIVESYHGGRLDLTWTQPGEGAEFAVRLPGAPPETAATRTASAPA